jgi:hypothetical protein
MRMPDHFNAYNTSQLLLELLTITCLAPAAAVVRA